MIRKTTCIKCGAELNYGMAENEYHTGPLDVDTDQEAEALEDALWALEPDTCQDRDTETYLICPECDSVFDTAVWVEKGLLVPKTGSQHADLFYFHMESSGGTPFLRGWVAVHAADLGEAVSIFRKEYPSEYEGNYTMLLDDASFQALGKWRFVKPEAAVISAFHDGVLPGHSTRTPEEALCVYSSDKIRMDVLGGLCFLETESGHEIRIWEISLLDRFQLQAI